MAKKNPWELRSEGSGGKGSEKFSGLPRPKEGGKTSRRALRGGGEGLAVEPDAEENGSSDGPPGS